MLRCACNLLCRTYLGSSTFLLVSCTTGTLPSILSNNTATTMAFPGDSMDWFICISRTAERFVVPSILFSRFQGPCANTWPEVQLDIYSTASPVDACIYDWHREHPTFRRHTICQSPIDKSRKLVCIDSRHVQYSWAITTAS